MLQDPSPLHHVICFVSVARKHFGQLLGCGGSVAAVVSDSFDTVMGAGSCCKKADATRCLVPVPPHDPIRPTRATHMLYVQELEAYLINVATYPDAFQKKVEKWRDEPLD